MGRPTTAVSRRATAPVVAVALLVLLAIGLAGVVAAGLDTVEPPEPPPRAALELSVDADADRLAFAHLGGDDIDVGTLRLRVTIDDIPLAHQPPVPFFSATGFRPGPTGPFNTAADQRWEPGETESVRLAGTNAPALPAGARVRVEVSVGDHEIARLTATAG